MPKPQHDKFSIIKSLYEQAHTRPNDVAYIYLGNANKETLRLSYCELFQRVLHTSRLLEQNVCSGQRALLLYSDSLNFLVAFLSCLNSGIIAIPAPPPESGHKKRTLPRLLNIVEDSGATVVLTTKSAMPEEKNESVKSSLKELEWIDTSYLTSECSHHDVHYSNKQSRIAYLQYTSGSTTKPKGVVISHENLNHQLKALKASGGYCVNSVTVTWMPYYHDYGLVEGLLLPLFNGTPCIIMSPFSFVKRPVSWLQAISTYRATHTQAPNFAYAQCVERVTTTGHLDLSSLNSAAIAAEPINPIVMSRFYHKFKGNGFRWAAFSPGYGLAENTLAVTLKPMLSNPIIRSFDAEALGKGQARYANGDSNIVKIVSCGRPVESTSVVIVDPYQIKCCDNSIVGEIWVDSGSTALGYWQQEEESERVFEARLPGKQADKKTYLRTGDLGFIKNGELFVTSRLKDVIIVDGANHWPHDIEWTINKCHPAIKGDNTTVAFAVGSRFEQKLTVVLEVKKGFSSYNELFELIVSAISENHYLTLHRLVVAKYGSIPKTSSGKVQRSLCKKLFLQEEIDVLWSGTLAEREQVIQRGPLSNEMPAGRDYYRDTQAWLIAQVAKISNFSIDRIDPNKPISSCGLDSVGLLTLACAIEEQYCKKVQLADLVIQRRTLLQLANLLSEPRWESQKGSLVSLQTKGNRPPLYLVHPAGGNVACYTPLIRGLGNQQPVYGLQSRLFSSGEDVFLTFEEMASGYIEEIKSVQPTGPYYICGMCLGGLIAFEMAQQLTRNGEKVAFLGLIDPRNPPTLLEEIILDDEFSSSAVGSNQDDSFSYIHRLKNEALRKPPITFPDDLVPSDPVAKKVMQNNIRARDIYIPKVYHGNGTFFWASQTPGDLGFYHDPRVCWTNLFTKGLDIQKLNTNHFEILSEPHVNELAAKIISCLNNLEITTSESAINEKAII